MNISRFVFTLGFTLLLVAFSANSFAAKTKLHNPKYAKLILSKDGSKILTVAIDTAGKENKDYKVLYVSKKLDGTFSKPRKIPGRTKYKFHILNTVDFSTIKLPPLFDKKSVDKTEVNIVHWCNQKKLWERDEDKRRKYKKFERMTGDFQDFSPQKSFYATVNYKIRQDNTRWDYSIRRVIRTSEDLESAPECDFREKPELFVDLIPSKKIKSKRGVRVYLKYAGSYSTGRKHIDNKISWEKGGAEPKVDIVVKKADGTQVRSYEKPLDELYFKYLGYMNKRDAEKEETANFLVRVPAGGGTIEVSLDAGPMFGVLKASNKLE